MAKSNVRKLSHYFFLLRDIHSGLMFRPLVHFEAISVCGVSKHPLHLLYVNIQFSQPMPFAQETGKFLNTTFKSEGAKDV